MEDLELTKDKILREAFECRIQLKAYANSLLGNYSAAEDIVQEAMLVVVKKYDQFEEGTSMLAWCRAIVRIEVLRFKRERHKDQSLVERLLDDAIDAAFEEYQVEKKQGEEEFFLQSLWKCLDQVSQKSQDILKARFVDELSYQQIAGKVGVSIEAVRKSLFRLKKQIRTCVETRIRGAL